MLKSIPFLPSLITLGNAFCGLLVIVKVVDLAGMVGQGGDFARFLPQIEGLGLLILLAMLFDSLDGKVARLTHQTSDFGAQLDSLADAITFGTAPAVLAKFLIDTHARGDDAWLPTHPKLYYMAAALYTLCAVMRLARFNVETDSHGVKDHLEFRGLPSPAAALVIVSLILFYCGRGEEQVLTQYMHGGVYRGVLVSLPWVLAGSGILMVSTIPYPHVVNSLLRGKHSFPFLAAAVFILFLAALEWQVVVVSLCGLYLLSGPTILVYRWIGEKLGFVRHSDELDDDAEDDDAGDDDAGDDDAGDDDAGDTDLPDGPLGQKDALAGDGAGGKDSGPVYPGPGARRRSH